jgi:hypothetical protein
MAPLRERGGEFGRGFDPRGGHQRFNQERNTTVSEDEKRTQDQARGMATALMLDAAAEHAASIGYPRERFIAEACARYDVAEREVQRSRAVFRGIFGVVKGGKL